MAVRHAQNQSDVMIVEKGEFNSQDVASGIGERALLQLQKSPEITTDAISISPLEITEIMKKAEYHDFGQLHWLTPERSEKVSFYRSTG